MRNTYYDVAAVKEAITGIVPSFSTPFLENGEIDWAGAERNVEFLLDSGAKTILLTLGDSLLTILTDREVLELTRFVVERTNHQAMVIGCGKPWCLSQSLEFAEVCSDMGCDLVIPVPPDWAQHSQADYLLEYYQAVAQKMPVMVLTNLLNGRGVPLEVFERIKPDSGIVALKDDALPPYGRRVGSIARDKMAFLQGGTMEGFLNAAPYGADGYLPVFFRAFPAIDAGFWNAYTENRVRDAISYIDRYELPFFAWCDANHANFDAGIRGMMELAGITKRFTRKPYSQLNDRQMESLQQFLLEKGCITGKVL